MIGRKMLSGAMGVACVLASACRQERKELSFDASVEGAEELSIENRMSVREAASNTDLGGGYYAVVSHGWFGGHPVEEIDRSPEEVDFVEISIESGGSWVGLVKAFSMEDLPDEILRKEADELVQREDGEVVFDLGSARVVVEWPPG